MDKKFSITSAWVGIFMFFSLFLSASVSAQVQDITPPSLIAFSFAPTTIDTSTQAQTVTVTMRVTDDLSGFGVSGIQKETKSGHGGSLQK